MQVAQYILSLASCSCCILPCFSFAVTTQIKRTPPVSPLLGQILEAMQQGFFYIKVFVELTAKSGIFKTQNAKYVAFGW